MRLRAGLGVVLGVGDEAVEDEEGISFEGGVSLGGGV